MLSVSIIFLYVAFTTYLTGYLALRGIGALFGAMSGNNSKAPSETPSGLPAPGLLQTVKADGYLMAGLVFNTVYAQIFSLFYKVGLLANLLLLGICGMTAVVFGRQLAEGLRQGYRSASRGRRLFYLFLFLLFAYGTSRGIIHYDTGLYHAQSIRWIEEYGVVKGLGNLHCRLAYNSSSFSLSALYSFAFLGGPSYHCMAGFTALLLAGVCSEVTEAWKRKRLFAADIARLAGFYYLFIIFDEMVSPASDYFTVLTIFYIVIRYLELAEKGERFWLPYGLLSLLGVYTMSLKLSAVPILLLTARPAAMLIRDKNIKGIIGCIGLGILILLPCFLRNILISGWMIYPFTAIDLFDVDWKIPKSIADYDAREIRVWGRGIHDTARFGESICQWFPGWFASQSALDRAAILGAAAAVPASLAGFLWAVKRKEEIQRGLMLGAVTVSLSFLFWLFSAPLIRYGCVYVWLAAPVTFGALALRHIRTKTFWRPVYILAGLLACYKILALGKEIAAGYTPEYLILQKDYENYQVENCRIQGIQFYYPSQGDQTGYRAFPSAPAIPSAELRGNSLKDGFRYKK